MRLQISLADFLSALAFLCWHYIFDSYVTCLTLGFNTTYAYFHSFKFWCIGHLHLKFRSVSFHSFKSKLNVGCGGYLDKIYKILVDILDVKAGFPLANFFIQINFFCSKTIRSRTGSYYFYLEKSC